LARHLALSSLWVLCLTWFGGHALADTVTRLHATSAAAADERQTRGDLVELAARYENGEGVTRDYARALALYCQAADLGDASAFLSLGWMYMNGRGVAINDPIAVRWFRKAADRGVPQAVNLLQMLLDVEASVQTGCPWVTPQTHMHHAVPTPEIRKIIAREAAEAGVDPNLIWAIIAIESEFNPRAVSVRNAQGLMQLMPETAARFHLTDTFDARQNIHAGTIYLRSLLDRFAGDLKAAIAAYNAGENAVVSHQGVPNFPETTKYVADVIRLYQSLVASPIDLASQ
jgi:soluble lytic murein transglycosylase-like protein